MADSEDTRVMPARNALSRLPSTVLAELAEVIISELNNRDADPDLDLSEGDLDRLADDDVIYRLDLEPVRRTRLFARRSA